MKKRKKGYRLGVYFLIWSFLCSLGAPVYASSINVEVGEFITLGRINKEPLWWVVVHKEKDVATLMCFSTITQMACNKDGKEAAKWEGSQLKKYLNETFYKNNFTADERALLVKYNADDEDLVYIPSLTELGLDKDTFVKKIDSTGKNIIKTNKVSYKGTAFQKVDFSLFKEDQEQGLDFALRNSDNTLSRLINVKYKDKVSLSYTSGTMKSSIRPVIKINTQLTNDNLLFTKKEIELPKKDGTKKVKLNELKYNISKVYINSVPLDLGEATPQILEGTTYVPLKLVSEKLGAKIEMNFINQAITVTKNQTVIMVNIGSKAATINGKWMDLQAPIIIFDEVIYVPLRFIVEELGGTVNYKNGTIEIRSDK
ncbi:stalk domain-containing protein [Sporanaerobium hydrogeniformans]|uniref:stalk domain-containing protein n=1 Tax=Sporanaerobium hydrogeniformans TaxID=3072179 RepID=UPI0015D4D6C7|nr:stalk domain-containing protein [Sporanaerobium hydrogeniformans]